MFKKPCTPEKNRRFMERNPKYLNPLQKFVRLLLTEKSGGYHFEGKGICKICVGHKKPISVETIVRRTRRGIELIFISACVATVAVIVHMNIKEKKVNLQTNPAKPDTELISQTDAQSDSESNSMVEICTMVSLDASNSEEDTLWELVEKYLGEKGLDCSNEAIDKIKDDFEERYPGVDPTRFQDGQKFEIIRKGGRIWVEML